MRAGQSLIFLHFPRRDTPNAACCLRSETMVNGRKQAGVCPLAGVNTWRRGGLAWGIDVGAARYDLCTAKSKRDGLHSWNVWTVRNEGCDGGLIGMTLGAPWGGLQQTVTSTSFFTLFTSGHFLFGFGCTYIGIHGISLIERVITSSCSDKMPPEYLVKLDCTINPGLPVHSIPTGTDNIHHQHK